jgi:hypothetical protein
MRVLIDMAICAVIGVLMVSSVVFIIPGAAVLAYGAVLGFRYAFQEFYGWMNDLGEWWEEGR